MCPCAVGGDTCKAVTVSPRSVCGRLHLPTSKTEHFGQKVVLHSSSAVFIHSDGHWLSSLAAADTQSPSPSHRGTRAAWVLWGISLVFQLSGQGFDTTVPKLQFNPCPWHSVCPAPSWTPQENLRFRQLQSTEVKIKAWAQSLSSASGWLFDLGHVPQPL